MRYIDVTRSQAVARIADRTASHRLSTLWAIKNDTLLFFSITQTNIDRFS